MPSFPIENDQHPQLQKSYSAFFYHDGQRGKLNRGAKGNFKEPKDRLLTGLIRLANRWKKHY